jgi:hypothetical protein
MIPTQEQARNAFLEWINAARRHKANWRDRCFIDAGGKEFVTAYLMGHLSSDTDTLPAAQTWIITGYPEFIGQHATPTYQNAARVVRTQRQQ